MIGENVVAKLSGTAWDVKTKVWFGQLSSHTSTIDALNVWDAGERLKGAATGGSWI